MQIKSLRQKTLDHIHFELKTKQLATFYIYQIIQHRSPEWFLINELKRLSGH